MTAIAFTESSLLNAKRALVTSFPDEKSAHLTEALAAACGYGSHAALRADMLRQDPADPDFILLDDEAFVRRLNALTNTPTSPNEYFGWFEMLNYPSKDEVISTQSMLGEEAQYRTARAWAWRNAMVSAINAGLSQRLFSVLPGDNRWPDAGDTTRRETQVFQFEIENIPAVGAVSDAGFDELSVHVALWPTPAAMDFTRAHNAGFAAGEAFASGWVERRDGAWLQYPRKPDLRCRSHRLATLVALDIRPKGYADRGSFKM